MLYSVEGFSQPILIWPNVNQYCQAERSAFPSSFFCAGFIFPYGSWIGVKIISNFKTVFLRWFQLESIGEWMEIQGDPYWWFVQGCIYCFAFALHDFARLFSWGKLVTALYLLRFTLLFTGRLYAMQTGMKIDSKTPECRKFLVKLMDQLEIVSINLKPHSSNSQPPWCCTKRFKALNSLFYII